MFTSFFLTPLLATIIFIFALYPCAKKIGLMDEPDHRKHHHKSTPLIGGLAIYLALLFTLGFSDIHLPNQTAFISSVTLLVIIGLIDDRRGLGVRIRLIAQIIAALIMTEIAEIKIIDLGDLMGFGEVNLGFFSTAFTVFAVVGGINAFNMIDGIDGLAGSLTLVSIGSIAAVSWYFQESTLFYYCSILIASIIAFLLFNLRIFGRSNGTIFLGDTGSTLLGFAVCWLSINASQGEHRLITPTTVLWIIALPLFDSICIMCRRIGKGMSPFAPDRNHLHHILAAADFTTNQTLLIILSFSVVLAITGITASFFLNIKEQISFFYFLLLFACHYLGMVHAWKLMKLVRLFRLALLFNQKTVTENK
ncbi:MAG: UDP-N-acetylglucosamine--undecaprenyl-phosphate N-acetylglucosaminephosphotransferase [Methylococcaceae bacterium]